ncbi:MAG: GAF domain-containing protein [Anaerolineae bacterium]|nr:GAF domain-containing protein [Anaerolineae bacterium]
MSGVESYEAEGQAQELENRQIAAMQKRLRELTFLHETSRILAATLDLDGVLRSLMAQVRDYFQVDATSVALLDEEAGELVFRVAVGEAAEKVTGLRLSSDLGVVGWVARSGEPLLVPKTRADGRFYAGVDESTGFETRVILAVPIKAQDRTIGVIEALNPTDGAFNGDAQRLLLSVADLAAVAIQNAELYERARQAERRYESLFNEGSDPVMVLDLDGKILDINRRTVEAFGRPRDQVIGEMLSDLLEIPSKACQEAIRQVLEGHSPVSEVKLQSGEDVRTLETHMVKIDYGGREAIQWLGHDVSERVALEKVRGDLTHMIVHDLRNPLGSIMGSLQLIHTAFVERDETLPITKLLSVAMRSGQKLYLLIDSLLDLGRLEAGETELSKTSVDVGALVQEAAEQIQPFALSRRQDLSTRVAAEVDEVLADRDLILRVLTNLLDNAVKFTHRNGHITLRAERVEDEVLFTVADDGIGILPEYRQRIFERFTRLENADGVKGTGLGLAFCKLAVEAHRGRIWVESEVDQGSQFKFTLPLGDG